MVRPGVSWPQRAIGISSLKDAIDLYLHGGVARHVVADPQPERFGLAGSKLIDGAAGSAHDRAVGAIERYAENGTQLSITMIYRFAKDLIPATAALFYRDVGEGDLLSGSIGHKRSSAMDR